MARVKTVTKADVKKRRKSAGTDKVSKTEAAAIKSARKKRR